MRVVINNWREDGEKEAGDDRSGITMDYLIHAAVHAQRCSCDTVRGRHITHRAELWRRREDVERLQQASSECLIVLPCAALACMYGKHVMDQTVCLSTLTSAANFSIVG